jgi:hypothetical protein
MIDDGFAAHSDGKRQRTMVGDFYDEVLPRIARQIIHEIENEEMRCGFSAPGPVDCCR